MVSESWTQDFEVLGCLSFFGSVLLRIFCNILGFMVLYLSLVPRPPFLYLTQSFLWLFTFLSLCQVFCLFLLYFGGL